MSTALAERPRPLDGRLTTAIRLAIRTALTGHPSGLSMYRLYAPASSRAPDQGFRCRDGPGDDSKNAA